MIAFDTSAALGAYQAAFRHFTQLPGFSQRDVLRAEAGVILKAWAGATKTARADDIIRRTYSRASKRAFTGNDFGLSVNNGARGGNRGAVWFRTRKDKFQLAGRVTPTGQWKPASLHFRNADWQRVNQGGLQHAGWLRAMMPAAKQSAGLARQSVVQIADALGIDLAAVKGGGSLSGAGIAKARAAIASNGRAYKNGTGREAADDVRYHVELINSLPFGTKAGLDRDLAGVLANRAKYIETGYAKGAFDSMQRVARAFPNLIHVTTSSNGSV